MKPLVRIAIACVFVFVVGFVISIGGTRPAGAQGGIVCDFGPKKYKDCCRESYREHRRLSASKRADDIDACMDRKSAKKKPAKEESKETSSKETKERAKDKDKDNKEHSKGTSKDEPTKPVEEKKKD